MAKNYTKDLIRKEFIKLLNKKKLHNITVTELAKACNIERKTFYYHFTDVYDLLKYNSLVITKDALDTLEEVFI